MPEHASSPSVAALQLWVSPNWYFPPERCSPTRGLEREPPESVTVAPATPGLNWIVIECGIAVR